MNKPYDDGYGGGAASNYDYSQYKNGAGEEDGLDFH
jgi:hypothetical protein